MNTEEAAAAVGATFRQVDFWIRSGIIAPSATAQTRYGEARRWSRSDIDRLRVVAQIMAIGGDAHGLVRSGDTATLVMRHWRKGPGWLVLSPLTGKGALAMRAEKVPKAVRMVGGRAMVVPLS